MEDEIVTIVTQHQLNKSANIIQQIQERNPNFKLRFAKYFKSCDIFTQQFSDAVLDKIYEAIKTNNSIRTLNIFDKSVARTVDRMQGSLAVNRSIKTLALGFSENANMEAYEDSLMTRIRQSESITSLRLIGIKEDYTRIISGIINMPRIRSLHIVLHLDTECQALCRLLEERSFESVSIEFRLDPSIPLLNQLARCNNTKVFLEFRLENTKSKEAVHNILAALKPIRFLNVRISKYIEHNWAKMQEFIEDNSNIESLRLTSCTVPHDCSFINSVFNLNNLTEFIIFSFSFNQEVALLFAKGIENNTTLTKLKIHGCFHRATAANFGPIADALKSNKSIEYLTFNMNMITLEDVNRLADIIRVNTTLTSLDMSQSSIAHPMKIIFNALSTNKTLKKLRAVGNELKNSFEDLKTMLIHNKTLEKLDLSCTSITVDQLKVISEGLKMNQSVTSIKFDMDERANEYLAEEIMHDLFTENFALNKAMIRFFGFDLLQIEMDKCLYPYLERNKDQQVTLQSDLPVLFANIKRSSSGALQLFPVEVWHLIFDNISYPGVKTRSLCDKYLTQ